MNYENVDKVLNLFSSFWPNGSNFYDATYEFEFGENEQDSILMFLTEYELLIPWVDHGKYIISFKGNEVINEYGTINNYLNYLGKQKAEEAKKQQAINTKIMNDAKLSTWQVKTYWPVFIFAIIGFIMSIKTIIVAIIKHL